MSKSWFFPKKYFSGLSAAATRRRKKEIKRFGSLHWKNPAAYKGFETNKLSKTQKKSSYTAKWDKLYPNVKTLKNKSKLTGVPVENLNHVFRKGLAAWRTGHRPGATQGEWAHARLASFLLCGKTYYTTDAANAQRAKNKSSKARRWFRRCKTQKIFKK